MNSRTTYLNYGAFLLVANPASVIAAQSALGEQFSGYTASTIGVVLLLICVGGFTGLLHRMKQEYDNGGELIHPRLFVATNLVGAVAAGTLGLLLGEHWAVSGALHAIIILVGSYAGTLFFEKVFDWIVSTRLPSSGGSFGLPKRPRHRPDQSLEEPDEPPQGNAGKFD